MESPLTFFAHKPINPDTYLADLRREHPRYQPSPPTFWHIVRYCAVYGVGSSLLILIGGICSAASVSDQELFGRVVGFFWGALIVFLTLSSFNLIVGFGEARARLRESFEHELRQMRWIHDSVLLQGVVTKAELKFSHTSFRSGYTDLPPDDRLVADVQLMFAFQTPDGATKTGHWLQRLGTSYYGENNKPDSKNYDPLKKEFNERYGSIVGATVYIHYLDENNYRLL